MDLLNTKKLKEALSDYVKVKTALLKLELKEHISDALAKLVAYIIILLIASIVLLFLSIGIALLINHVLSSQAYVGFVIVAGFYLIVLFVVLMFLRSGKLKMVIEDAMLNEQIVEDEAA